MSLRKALSRRLGGGGGGDKSRAGAGASGSYGGDEGAGNDVDNEQEEDGCDDDDEGFSSRTSSFGGLTLRKTRTNASVTSSNGRGDEAVRERAIEKLRSLEPPQDPVEFALRALEPLMSYHAKNDSLTMQDLAEHHVPRYFSLHYVHQVNCHVLDLQAYVNRIANLQKSLKRACMCLHYEWVIHPLDRDEEVRLRGTGIFDIRDAKMVRGMVVVDTSVMSTSGPDLACVVS